MKSLNFMKTYLLIFGLIYYWTRILFRKPLPILGNGSIFPTMFFGIFRISGLILASMMN